MAAALQTLALCCLVVSAWAQRRPEEAEREYLDVMQLVDEATASASARGEEITAAALLSKPAAKSGPTHLAAADAPAASAHAAKSGPTQLAAADAPAASSHAGAAAKSHALAESTHTQLEETGTGAATASSAKSKATAATAANSKATEDKAKAAAKSKHAAKSTPVSTLQTSKTVGYSTNAICSQYNCINPVVPGLTDLTQLSATSWQCQEYGQVRKYMNFCKNALYYDPGVPNPKKSMKLEDVIAEQDNAASTMYFYALSGMNAEPWLHRQPWLEQDPCVTAVWKTVCNTYFPRAEAGCKKGQPTKYLRPCKNVCQNYLSACNVQCCDESVQCVFNKTVLLQDGKTSSMEGYVDQLGPSAMCTGAAFPRATIFGGFPLMLIACLAVLRLGH